MNIICFHFEFFISVILLHKIIATVSSTSQYFSHKSNRIIKDIHALETIKNDLALFVDNTYYFLTKQSVQFIYQAVRMNILFVQIYRNILILYIIYTPSSINFRSYLQYLIR